MGMVDGQLETQRPRSLREVIAAIGPATIVTMVVVGPGTMATMLQGGATLGTEAAWIVLFSALVMWMIVVLANKTTCLTGKPPLEVLGDLWRPLILIGGIFWLIPQFFIVMVQGVSTAQTTAAITGLPASIAVWPTLILAGIVFYSGGFGLLRKAASILLTALLVISLIFVLRLLIGGELPIGQALSGLFIPRWPNSPETAALFGGAVGGGGSWGILAYQGYAIIKARKNKPGYLWESNAEAFLLGFLMFGIFALSVYWLSAGVFFPQGVVPATAPEAATLFGPFLGNWSYLLFYGGFLGALFTTLAGTNLLLVTSVFAMIHHYRSDDQYLPVMENPRFKTALWIALFLVAGVGSLPGRAAILPMLIWSLGLANLFTGPAVAVWLYLTNSRQVVGEQRNSWYFNVAVLAMLIGILYIGIQSLPDVLRNPFSF